MVERSKRFVYGKFHWPADKLPPPPRPPFPLVVAPPLTAWDQVAIEILREYGANELIGKLYSKGAFNNWVPIEPSQVADIDWFKWAKRLGPTGLNNPNIFHFDMEGSGRWSVLHFRNESDETGPYVAVALKYAGQ